ncbi:MAG: hypothetical protein E2P03_00105 [Acidobacteria bacterium]|nr:MAG: hypothetical protein E2P03_00105 [Acidobacteriota bacterium]
MSRAASFLYRILFLALSSILGGVNPVSGQILKILPLGDSITQANVDHYGYRYRLWVKLVDSGVTFDFIGSGNMNLWGNPPWPPIKGKSFDSDHEGHWGWEANEILDGRVGEGNLASWLQDYTPDIVLMHLGTNDALHEDSTESTVQELEQIIQVLQADNPAVTILMAILIPSTDPQAWRIPAINAEVPAIARRMQTPTSRIIVVDQWTGFDTSTNLYDQWHPNDSGEEKMAQKWFEALLAVAPLAIELQFEPDLETLSWQATIGAEFYSVYKIDPLSLLDTDGDGLPDAGLGDCITASDPDTSDTTFVDQIPLPAPNSAVFYLVAPVTSFGEISLGTTGFGLRRQPSTACP